MLCRNVLKLRKEKRLAEACGESSVTETPPICERRDDKSSKRVDFRHYAVPSEREDAEQEDWREVCLSLWRTSLIDLLSLCFSPLQRSHCDFTNARQGIVLLVSRSRGEWQAPLLINFQLLSHHLLSWSQKMVAYLLLQSGFLSQVLTSAMVSHGYLCGCRKWSTRHE